MSQCHRKGWQERLRVSKGVAGYLRLRPAFALVLQEVCRRHERDWPKGSLEGQLHRTLFQRDDLPGGGLVLRSTCSRGKPVSSLSFIGGTL